MYKTRWNQQIFQFGRTALVILGGNVVQQALGFISAIWIIRQLEVEDYALYGLALAITGVLTTLADSGVSQAALSLGGEVYQTPRSLGAVIASCRQMMTLNGTVASAVSVPLWFYMASLHSEDLIQIAAISILLVAGFWAAMGISIYRNVLLLHGCVSYCQTIEVLVGVGRVISLLALLQLYSSASSALAVNLGFLAVQKSIFRRKSATFFTCDITPSKEITTKIRTFVKRALPTSIYFAFSQQALFFIVVIVSSSAVVAGIGALSRLHQLFLVVVALSSAMLAPRFATCQQSKNLPFEFMRLALVGGSVAVIIGGIIYAFPDLMLIPLGESYAGYTLEVRLLSVSSALASIVAVLSALNNARGWIIPPYLVIALNAVSVIGGLAVFPIHKLSGYFSMHILIQTIMLMTVSGWSIHSLVKRSRI
jgi:O-antigen/teichoic acid export membrane protein